ncbi:DUF6153 family protein [Streptomyces longwoodensis]|uniref:DUF6153 family protein n=1 Tax=Streptomyces TaxID=1883 RepID=UPI00369ECABE
MTGFGQLTRPQWTLRYWGLLVCALLLGLLGMHGLGPAPAAATASGHDRMAATAHTDVRASIPGECDHGDGGCTGHANHADPTCASASVSGAPALVPTLLPDLVTCVGTTTVCTCPVGGGPEGGRAPPSLSELQLLRI